MNRKMAALLVMGLVIGICGFSGAGQKVYAEGNTPVQVTATTEYVTVTKNVEVHENPGTAWKVLGNLKAGQPAIVTGKTDNGWRQIYYIGMLGYIPGDAVKPYEMPKPTFWSNISMEGDIKINVLGDSISYGDKLANTASAYPYILGAACGAAKVNNYGLNGSAVGGFHADRLYDRYPVMDRDANLILVFGGTNDYGGYNETGTPVGAMGDITPDTFYGALNLMMCGLKQMYPECKIVFLTPLRRVGYMRRNRSGYYLNQYADAIKTMAGVYGIRVIDLLNAPELDFSSKQAIYLVDGLHPNENGQMLLAGYIYRKLFTEPVTLGE